MTSSGDGSLDLLLTSCNDGGQTTESSTSFTSQDEAELEGSGVASTRGDAARVPNSSSQGSSLSGTGLGGGALGLSTDSGELGAASGVSASSGGGTGESSG